MPLLSNILENTVFAREFKKGELEILRLIIEKRFGAIPNWAEERLVSRSSADLEELSDRVLDAASIEDLLKKRGEIAYCAGPIHASASPLMILSSSGEYCAWKFGRRSVISRC
jgi:hypothetical protein